MDSNLFIICITAFGAVFGLLSLLALVMQGIMLVYPDGAKGTKGTDQAHIAVITSTFQALIPGSKITRIEELQ